MNAILEQASVVRFILDHGMPIEPGSLAHKKLKDALHLVPACQACGKPTFGADYCKEHAGCCPRCPVGPECEGCPA